MKSVKTQTKPARKGFTIVEVTIVTAFVAVLLITITILITQITAIYQKGLTLKAIDAVGRNLVSELTSAINSAPSVDSTSLCNMLLSDDTSRKACIADNANLYLHQSYEASNTDEVTGVTDNVQYFGVLCTGDYSYVWNTEYGIDAGRTAKITYNYKVGDNLQKETLEDFKLVKFSDTTYRACSNNVTKTYKLENKFQTGEINIQKLANNIDNLMTKDKFQQGFLDASNVTLSLYELTIFPISQDAVTLRSFFAGTFILATERGGVNIVRSGDYCDMNDSEDGGAGGTLSLGSNFNYCGINKFNFAARTAGSGV